MADWGLSFKDEQTVQTPACPGPGGRLGGVPSGPEGSSFHSGAPQAEPSPQPQPSELGGEGRYGRNPVSAPNP